MLVPAADPPSVPLLGIWSFHSASLLPRCCDGVTAERQRSPAPHKGVVGLGWGIFTSIQLLSENVCFFSPLKLKGDYLHVYFTVSKPWKNT